jgi:hypothetical protein
VEGAELGDFPADTEAIGIKVTGADGGVLAIGKTAPLVLGALHDGADVPVFMAPPDGFCRTGDLDQPRANPTVAPAGAGALVVGGDAGGTPLSTVAYYDPDDAAFHAVDVPSELVDDSNGLHGAVLTPLPDGRVALTGTARGVIAYFDPAAPAALTPSPPPVLDQRAYHGAIALDAGHLFVIGGCSDVIAGACGGTARKTSFSYPLDDLAHPEPGPNLPPAARRIDATVFDLGIQDDGVRRFVLAGGTGDPGAADRLDPTAALGGTEELTGLDAQVAALAGGAVISAFAPDTAAPTGAADVLPPGGAAVVAIASAPARSGARLVPLEDGTVAAFGGDAAVARYDPTSDRWTELAGAGDVPPVTAGPAVTRLADGSVLVLDGTTRAWVFRPSLVGPQSGQVAALPLGTSAGVLVAPDPSTVSRSAGELVLTAPDASLAARVLVGGPTMATGTVSASVRVRTGGVALIAQQLGPGRALVAELVPGQPARIERLDAGHASVLASGAAVPEFDPTGATISLDVHGHLATVTANGASVSADLTGDLYAADRGPWGIAADGPGAVVEVTTITVTR